MLSLASSAGFWVANKDTFFGAKELVEVMGEGGQTPSASSGVK
jgi:hypothetical protein